jgi:4-alpha-glucanotransferase
MNIPGTPEGNWTFRVTAEALKSMNSEWLLELNRLYRRCMVHGVHV